MRSFANVRHRIMSLNALMVSIVLLVAACGDSASQPVTIQSQYSSAVYDARTVSPGKISVNLTPITKNNSNLLWENNIPGSRLLVMSWIKDSDRKYYDGTVNPACDVGESNCILSVDLWVTVVPEMKTFFSGIFPEPLRIAQLLGVPPEYSQEARSMVELWVAPRDIFRPCPDPEITDLECEEHFPANAFRTFNQMELIRASEGAEKGVFMNYTGWFNNRQKYIYYNERSYPVSSPYPWTRLGYTYDWGSSNHIGLSEFVVHGKRQSGSGISVGVRSLKRTKEYFEN